MNTLLFLSAVLQSRDDGLSLSDVLESLPTDPASIVAVTLTLASAAAVVWFGRSGRGGGTL